MRQDGANASNRVADLRRTGADAPRVRVRGAALPYAMLVAWASVTVSPLTGCSVRSSDLRRGDAAPAEPLVFQKVAPRSNAPADATADVAITWAAGGWRFDDQAYLRLDVNGDARVTAGSTLRVRAVAERLDGCELHVQLVEPVVAAHQTAFRGRVTAREKRGDHVEATATIADDGAALELVVPSPWRPAVVEIEAAVSCVGVGRRAVAGARREQRDPARGRVRDERLAVGVVPVMPTPWTLDVPLETAAAVDGEWPTNDAPTLTLADTRTGDALPIQAAAGRGPHLVASDTLVGFAWSPVGLVVRATMHDRDLAPVEGGRDAELWKGDAIEIFLAHADHDRYVELQASPSGALFDARFVARRQPGGDADGGVAWNGRVEVGVDVRGSLTPGDTDDGWDVELLVPWSDLRAVGVLDGDAVVGTRLRANVIRVERARDGRIAAAALAPTREPDFHAMAEAVTLVLAKGAGS